MSIEMHSYMYRLPKYYRSSRTVNLLMETEGSAHDYFGFSIQDIVENCYIETATWGLDIFEEMAGIYTDPSKPLEDRRAVLRSRYGGFGTATIPFLKLVAEKFQNGEIEVTNIPRDYVVEIEFISTLGVPRNIPDLQKALEDTIPAHYEARFRFRYLAWDILDSNDYAWDEWDQLDIQWFQVSRIEE